MYKPNSRHVGEQRNGNNLSNEEDTCNATRVCWNVTVTLYQDSFPEKRGGASRGGSTRLISKLWEATHWNLKSHDSLHFGACQWRVAVYVCSGLVKMDLFVFTRWLWRRFLNPASQTLTRRSSWFLLTSAVSLCSPKRPSCHDIAPKDLGV